MSPIMSQRCGAQPNATVSRPRRLKGLARQGIVEVGGAVEDSRHGEHSIGRFGGRQLAATSGRRSFSANAAAVLPRGQRPRPDPKGQSRGSGGAPCGGAAAPAGLWLSGSSWPSCAASASAARPRRSPPAGAPAAARFRPPSWCHGWDGPRPAARPRSPGTGSPGLISVPRAPRRRS